MDNPVKDTVYFHVTVSSSKRDDHWVARTLETSLFAYGETREAAENSAADANVLVIQEVKLQGLAALEAFMTRYNIDYSIGTVVRSGSSERPERIPRAA